MQGTSEPDNETSRAIDAIVEVYGMEREAAESALELAAAGSSFEVADFARLFADPDRSPLPEAAAKGYALEKVLDVIKSLALMLGRGDMAVTARELKGIWAGQDIRRAE